MNIHNNNWETWKVSRAFKKIGSGTTPRSDQVKYFESGPFNWLITGDLNDGIIRETSRKITQSAIVDYPTLKIYPPGSIAIAMYGATIGKIGLLAIPSSVNQACCVLVPGKLINPKFAYYLFLASKKKLIDLSLGGGQPNISQEIVRSFRINLAPKNVQNTIVGFLDIKVAKIDAAIAKKKRLLDLLEEKRTSIIDGITTDSKLQSLKRVTVLINRGASPNYEEEGEASFINQACIYWKGLKFNATKNAKRSSHPIGSRGYLYFGDLLVNSTGTGTLGRVALFDIENKGTHFADSHVTIARPDKKKIVPKYLLYVMRTTKFQDEIYTSCVSGSTNQIELSREKFRDLAIPIPKLSDQKKTVEKLDKSMLAIAKVMDKTNESILLLNEYKTSLISNAVTGRVKI